MSASSLGTTRGRRSAKSGGRSGPWARRGYHVYISSDARRRPASTRAALLPSVDQALQRPELQAARRRARPRRGAAALRAALDELRERRRRGRRGPDAGAREPRGRRRGADRGGGAGPSLVRVINATGVVVHTNLGRAPLSPEAAARVAEIAVVLLEPRVRPRARRARRPRGPRRGAPARAARRRGGGRRQQLRRRRAARRQHAAEGREVLVSRGELVEIGGSFRIPDVLRKGGARLRRGRDHEPHAPRRLPRPRSRPTTGHDPEGAPEQLPHRRLHRGADARGARRRWRARPGSPLVEDQGSGLLARCPGALAAEATRRARRSPAGPTSSPSAATSCSAARRPGSSPGRRAYVEPMRRNPLYRALRVDKMTLAALDATLVEHAARARRRARLPVLRMIHAPRRGAARRAPRRFAARARRARARRSRRRSCEASPRWAAAPRPTAALPTVARRPRARPARRRPLRRALRAGRRRRSSRASRRAASLVDLRTVRPRRGRAAAPRRARARRSMTRRPVSSRSAALLSASLLAAAARSPVARSGAGGRAPRRRVTFRADVTQAFPGGVVVVRLGSRGRLGRGVGAARRPPRALLLRPRRAARARAGGRRRPSPAPRRSASALAARGGEQRIAIPITIAARDVPPRYVFLGEEQRALAAARRGGARRAPAARPRCGRSRRLPRPARSRRRSAAPAAASASRATTPASADVESRIDAPAGRAAPRRSTTPSRPARAVRAPGARARVLYAGTLGSRARRVVIDHGQGVVSVLQHLSRVVREGGRRARGRRRRRPLGRHRPRARADAPVARLPARGRGGPARPRRGAGVEPAGEAPRHEPADNGPA